MESHLGVQVWRGEPDQQGTLNGGGAGPGLCRAVGVGGGGSAHRYLQPRDWSRAMEGGEEMRTDSALEAESSFTMKIKSNQ